MKALSIQPFYATLIAAGFKFIELRTWKTDYRGWLLLCASKAVNKTGKASLMNGHAFAIAELSEVRPYNDEMDREAACLDDDETFEGFSWVFNRIIPIKPFPVKGKLHLFDVEQELDSLELLELDYGADTYPEQILLWWKENGFIENMDFLEG